MARKRVVKVKGRNKLDEEENGEQRAEDMEKKRKRNEQEERGCRKIEKREKGEGEPLHLPLWLQLYHSFQFWYHKAISAAVVMHPALFSPIVCPTACANWRKYLPPMWTAVSLCFPLKLWCERIVHPKWPDLANIQRVPAVWVAQRVLNVPKHDNHHVVHTVDTSNFHATQARILHAMRTHSSHLWPNNFSSRTKYSSILLFHLHKCTNCSCAHRQRVLAVCQRRWHDMVTMMWYSGKPTMDLIKLKVFHWFSGNSFTRRENR